VVVLTLNPIASYAASPVSIPVLVALLVCLIPTTIGALLSAIGIAGMDRLVQRNVLAMSGRAVEAAGDVTTLLLDKTGTITYGNRRASDFVVMRAVDGNELARVAALSSLTEFVPDASVGDVFASTLRRFVPAGFLSALGTPIVPTTPLVVLLFQWVGPAFWTVFVFAALQVYRATFTGRTLADEEHFRALLRLGGGGTLGFMGTWPGNVYWFSSDGESAIAYRVVGGIAVKVTDPRPVGLFDGYHRDDAANEKAFRDGWYYTGDKAWRDSDGYLWFEGRDDDVITSSAYRIGPFEVESALVEHPAVAEAAVVGKDDPERTQLVTAFVILAPGREGSPELAAELQEHTKNLTAPYKYPREIHFVDELPKTVSGKIRRSELREQLRSGAVG